MNSGSSQRQVRYGERTRADMEECAVRITSADFNGESFDGSPFSTQPIWLKHAIRR